MATQYTIPYPDLLLDTAPIDVSVRQYVLRIQDMPIEDKPREKLLKHGAHSISVPELVAVILNTGTKKEDVMSMAHRIVREYGERSLSQYTNPQQMADDLDIPLVKALQIVACAELGKRFFSKSHYGSVTIRTARDVYEYLQDMRTLSKEHLRGLYINTHHKIIHDEVISIGTINSNVIHPREVFKPAIEYGATAIILAHNHPSGIVTPSQADIDITNQIIAAGKLIGIPLIDHIIIGDTTFASIEVHYE